MKRCEGIKRHLHEIFSSLEAVREFDKASNYYGEIRDGLGQNCEDDFDVTLEKILTFPEAWPPIKQKYRRCSFAKFPFGIIYRLNESEDECLIFAIMHFKRRPNYWEDRKF